VPKCNVLVNLHINDVVLSANWYGRSMLITAALTLFISVSGYAVKKRTSSFSNCYRYVGVGFMK